MENEKEIRYFSMFSGIGGFELGIERAFSDKGGFSEQEEPKKANGDKRGDNVRIEGGTTPLCCDSSKTNNSKICSNTQQRIRNEKGRYKPFSKRSRRGIFKKFYCVGFSEIDKYAIQIYQKHFPKHRNFGDATKINPDDIPDFDLLTAGFPCQSFSIAGKRKGFDDTRGTLFFEICRIAKAKRPRILLLENVKGLLSHGKSTLDIFWRKEKSLGGRTFARIIQALDELGYDVEWQVLNSKNFGVPQNRERVFIIGHLRGGGGRQVFPIGETTQGSIKICARGKHQQDIVYDTEGILNLPAGTHGSTPHLTKILDKKGKYKEKDVASCLSGGGHSGGNHSDMDLIYVGAIMSEKNKKWLEDGKTLSRNFPQGQRVYSKDGIASSICGDAGGLGGKTGLYAVLTLDRINKRQHGRRMKEDGEPSFTLTGQDVHGISDGTRIRRLTPTECERLQGFPQLSSFINIKVHNNIICVDLQKSYVNVEDKNHKLQKHVGNVEKIEERKDAAFVEKNLNTKSQQKNKLVQEDVHINCVEEKAEIHNQGKSYSFVDYVESQNSFHQHIKTEDFVQMIVGINSICERIIHNGKVASHQNGVFSIHQENGKAFVELYGKEIMQLAKDVKKDSTILKKHLKYITSNHLNTKDLDSKLIISFFYVISAIIGYIQNKTKINNSLNLNISSNFGYTYGVSDTQRYKCLGNAVTVNVIEAITEELIKTL